MGSCAALYAFPADALERLRALPAPASGEDPRDAAELVPWEGAVVAGWRDPSDNDLSRIARGERRGLPAVPALAPLLGIDVEPGPRPWWVEARWPSDGFLVGLLAPAEVREVRDAAAGAWSAVGADALEGLEAFLDQAARAGWWVLGVEGQS